ncbi:MAG: hypothetical protein IKV22_07720, partial [Paludibacteraceae bacterium]|nr:hypothetical protein [Paludibacteraceae bacterium]
GNVFATSATNVSFAILSIQEKGIDFQGKRVLKWISTDFWEMSVKKYELFAEIAVAQSIIFPVTIPLSLRGDKQRI